jgi:hypothetical protein
MAPWQHWKEDGAPPYFYFLHEGGEIVVINVLPLGHLDGDIATVHRATVDFAETVEHGTRMQQIQCKKMRKSRMNLKHGGGIMGGRADGTSQNRVPA